MTKADRITVYFMALCAEGISEVKHNSPFMYQGKKWMLYSINLENGMLMLDPCPES